ncbi:hypothetical protein MTO96_014164 [Rhipicephalus appendiculatus]
MTEDSPPSSATPVEHPRRSLVRTSSHRRSASVACTRMLWTIIANAEATRLRHEQAQQLCKVVGERPTAPHLSVLAADAETIASIPASPGTPCLPVSTAVSSDTSAALESAFPGVPGIVDSEPDPDDMDTTSTRKRSRPSEPSSDDEGASRKMQAVATERPTVTSPTASSTNVVAELHSTTKDADVTNETEFQLVLSKSQKPRQRTSPPQRPVANIGPPPGTAPAATPAAHSSTARDVHGLANPLSATQAAAAGVPAAADTMLTSAAPLLDSCTVLFRPTNAGRPSCTAIDVSLASEGARYDWATQPDSWGSDHLLIIITPVGGKIRRTRQCNTVDWRVFRQRLRDTPGDQDFLGLVAEAAQAATVQSRVPEKHPAPDLRHLNLRAARRRAERRYLKAQSPEHRTFFNRVDAVCRRHANRRRRQSWQGICHSLSQARGSSRAWRLLRSLVIGPTLRQAVLAVAIRLGISEQELAERLADRFAAQPVGQPAAITTAPSPKPPQGHHPTWTASQISALCQEPITLESDWKLIQPQ